MKKSCLLIALSLACVSAFAQFPYGLASPSAQEDFRLGVQSYHKGRMAESVLLFERVLASSPRDPLALFWMGRTYFKNGLESTALDRWDAASKDGGRSLLVESFEEYVSSRRSIEPGIGKGEYVVSGEFPGRQGKEKRFLRPSWIQPLQDGSVLVVSHGTGEVLKIDANGVIRARYGGGLGGFDRPFALAAAPDGGFWVSEFQGDRLCLCSPDGNVVLRVSGGSGQESLSGPQYIATDASGFLFVVDYGNGRVVKYSPKGEYLLDFGKPTPGFPGLRSPTGIACRGGRVYVADEARKAVYVFDDSGNYLDRMAEGSLLSPEGLTFSPDGTLLIADRRRVLAANVETYSLRELHRSGRPDAKISSASLDVNGNIVTSDFDASLVEILSDPAVVYGGYFLEIERLRSDAFPVVEADVYVRDRFGNPIVGLDQRNFYATEHVVAVENVKEGGTNARIKTESMVPVRDLSLVGKGSDTPECSTAIIVERSPQMEGFRSEVRSAVESTVAGLGDKAETRLVTAGRTAALVSTGSGASDGPALARQAISAPCDGAWRFDSALRLAVSSLTGSSLRSAIVYISTGGVNEEYFAGVSLAELGAFLRNNGIRFYAVIVGDARTSAAVNYLVDTAGGAIAHVWDPAGLAVIGRDLHSSPSGRYRLRFTSSADPGFGRTYLSVAMEVYLFKKSGRDELGYFAPVK